MDYKRDFYDLVRQSSVYANHDCIFPHETDENSWNDRAFYQTIDLFVAEISHPSTGLGIELGWASEAGCKIVCVHKADVSPSAAIRSVCQDVMAYKNHDELIALFEKAVISIQLD